MQLLKPLSRNRDELAISPEMLRWLRVLHVRANHVKAHPLRHWIGFTDRTALGSIRRTLEELIEIGENRP